MMRHAWSERFCGYLNDIKAGEDAAKLGLRRSRQVWVAPMFAYRVPCTDLGRKASSPDGSQTAFPIRVLESPIVVDGSSVHLCGSGLGVTIDETVAISTVAEMRRVSDVIERGNTAWWEWLDMLTPVIHLAAKGACRWAERTYGASPIEVDDLAFILQYGAEGQERWLAKRLYDQAVRMDRFARVDPSRYTRFFLAPGAVDEMRRLAGDPRAGVQIRGLIDEIRPSTMDDLVDAYRARYGRGIRHGTVVDAVSVFIPDVIPSDVGQVVAAA